MTKILQWLRKDDGATAVEYALIAALAAALFGAAYVYLGSILFDFFSTIIDSINPF